MKRDFLKDLHGWFDRENHKPLIIRGARQVGKTWLVRIFVHGADEFSKYGKLIDVRLLGTVFTAIPRLVGQKIKYVNIDRNERAKPLADCIDMLEMARVIYGVVHSAGNGVPLGAETNAKDRKPLFLDVGLLCCALGLKATDLHQAESLISLPLYLIGETNRLLG